MSDNLKEWILMTSIISVSTFFGYGANTIYNGDSLGVGYVLTGLIIISGVLGFYLFKK